jgi:uncharacterized alkaline shock family protein YloU
MVIAGTAATEADGVFKSARKHTTKCSVIVRNKVVTMGVSIAVKFGAKVHEVSADVQKRVKAAIETMTGLEVAEVNVKVSAIVGEKAPQKSRATTKA